MPSLRRTCSAVKTEVEGRQPVRWEVGRMRATLLFVALGMGLLLPAISFAQSPETPPAPPAVFTQFKPDDVVAILKDAGYSAELIHQNNSYRIGTGMGGRRISLYLYCDDNANCTSLTWELDFKPSPDFTMTMANKWNRDKRYSKAYIDTDGGMVVQYDLAFSGGLTKDAIAESARLFERIVGLFDTYINSPN
jgi:hypothetical protein